MSSVRLEGLVLPAVRSWAGARARGGGGGEGGGGCQGGEGGRGGAGGGGAWGASLQAALEVMPGAAALGLGGAVPAVLGP